MQLRPFQPSDLSRIELQDRQRDFYTCAPEWYVPALAERSIASYTLLSGGQVLACVGVVERDESTGVVWLFLSRFAKVHMLTLTRAARRYLEVTGKRVLETTCITDFAAAHRWLRMLGFLPVKTLPAYGADGADHFLYRRSLK
jgi:hypothetical protein